MSNEDPFISGRTIVAVEVIICLFAASCIHSLACVAPMDTVTCTVEMSWAGLQYTSLRLYSWETIWHGWMIPSVTLYAIRNSRTFLGPWRLFTSCISWYWLMNYLHGDSCHWGAGHGWTLRDATHWKMNVSIIFEFNRLFSITVICISFLVLYPACFFILS